ncbi:alpha/beta hydrolase family protein [Acinetobacter sp. SFA]|uniref:alpha/beta hydrolase family protein n=1 Tax=Acinetobacter sp. SFA TaxID=1805633 RepID=UPI000B0F6003
MVSVMKTKSPLLKIIVGCAGLGSAYLLASPAISRKCKNQDSQKCNHHNCDIAAKTPGTLLAIEEQSTDLFPHAAQRFLITYRSRGIHSEPIVVSGFVLLPQGKPPRGGWPVLAWAHGTTGVADTCAPSGDYVGGPVHAYQELASKPLDAWLAQGYAVVATDYQGLGTPGKHPYMNAQSQLHTVVDSVRALHFLKPYHFSRKWYVMGHSQGGAAALMVAAHGQKDAPELKLRGALVVAPGGYQYEGIAQYAASHPQIEKSVVAFLPIVLLGAEAADPSLNIMNLLSPEMAQIVNYARNHGLSELQADVKEAPQTVFKPDADLNPLIEYSKKQSIENMIPTVPVMIIQGNKDQIVDYQGTHAYYQLMCTKQKPIAFKTVEGADHHGSLRQSQFMVEDFINSVEQGKFMSTCETN